MCVLERCGPWPFGHKVFARKCAISCRNMGGWSADRNRKITAIGAHIDKGVVDPESLKLLPSIKRQRLDAGELAADSPEGRCVSVPYTVRPYAGVHHERREDVYVNPRCSGSSSDASHP